jgi:hypothetical protein
MGLTAMPAMHDGRSHRFATTELYLYISMKVCDKKHGGFYVTIDLFSWGFPLTRGSNIRGRQSSTPPGFYSDLGLY